MPKYKDTALNRRLGRVGKEHGSADITKLPPKKKKDTPPPPPKTPPPKKKDTTLKTDFFLFDSDTPLSRKTPPTAEEIKKAQKVHYDYGTSKITDKNGKEIGMAGDKSGIYLSSKWENSLYYSPSKAPSKAKVPPPPKTPPPKKKRVKEMKPDSPKTARKFALGILGESEKSYNDKYSKQLVKKRALQKEVKTKVPKYLALKKKLGGGTRVDKDGKPVPAPRKPKPPSYESVVKTPVPAPRKPKVRPIPKPRPVKKASKASKSSLPPPPPPGKPPPKKSVSKPKAKADMKAKADKKEPKTFKMLGKSAKPLDRAKLLRKIRAGSTREKGQSARLQELGKTKLEGGLKKKLQFKPKDDKSEPKKNPKKTGSSLGKPLKKKGKYSPQESKQSKVDLFGGKTKSKINVRKLDTIKEERPKPKPKPKKEGGRKAFKLEGRKGYENWKLVGSATAEYPKIKATTGKEPRKVRYYDRGTRKFIKEIPKNEPGDYQVPDEFFGKKDDRSAGDKILINIEDDGIPQDPQLLKLFPKEALTEYPTNDYGETLRFFPTESQADYDERELAPLRKRTASIKKGRKLLDKKRVQRDRAKLPVRKVSYKELKKGARPALIKKGKKLLQKKRDKRIESRLTKLQNTTSDLDLDKLIDQKYDEHKAQTKQNIALVGLKSKPKPLPKASVGKKGNLRKPVGYVAGGKLPGTSKNILSPFVSSGGGAQNLTITISDKDETRLLNKRTLREGELIKGKKTIQYGEGKIIIADSIGASRENLNLPTAAQTLPKVREQVGGGMVKLSNIIQPPSLGGIGKAKTSRSQDIFETTFTGKPPSDTNIKYDSIGNIIEAGDWFDNAMTYEGIDGSFGAKTEEVKPTKVSIGERVRGGVFGAKKANPKDILPEGGSFRKGRKFDQARITNTNVPDPKRTGKKTKRQLLDLELGTDKSFVKLVRNPNYYKGVPDKIKKSSKVYGSIKGQVSTAVPISEFLRPGEKLTKQIGGKKVLFKERGGGIIKKSDPPPKKAPPKPKVPTTTKTFLAGKKVKDLTPEQKKEYEKVKKQNQRYGKNLKKYNDFISAQPKVRSSRPYVKRAGDNVSGLSVKESLAKLGKTQKKADVGAKPKFEISERAKKAKAESKAKRAGDVKTIAGRVVPRTFRDRRIKGKEKSQTLDLAVEKDVPKKYKKILKSIRVAEQATRLKGVPAEYDAKSRDQISDPNFIPRDTKPKQRTLAEYEQTDKANSAGYKTTGIGDATTFIDKKDGIIGKQAKEQMEKNAQLLTEHSDKVQRTKNYDYNKLKRANRYATKDKIETAGEEGTIKKVGAKLAGRFAPNTARKSEQTMDDKIRDIAVAQAKGKSAKRVKGFLDGQNVGTSYKTFVRSNPKPAGPDPRFYGEGGVYNDAREQQGEDDGYAEWADYADSD